MRSRNVSILGVAAGKGAETPGAEQGPQALRQLGIIGKLEQQGHVVDDLGDIPGVGSTELSPETADINWLPNISHVNRHTRDCVYGTLSTQKDTFMLVVGGDHSLAIGVLAGIVDTCQRLGIVWIDAHGDYNTPTSSPSGNAHGMSLAVACGYGYLELRQLAMREPFAQPEDVVLLGTRDIDPGELAGLSSSGIRTHHMETWRRNGIVDTALASVQELATRCDHIHLSFDIDALNADLVPGTGTPVPGGLMADEALSLFDALSQIDLISSAEFVEYNPTLDPDGTTGTLTLNLIERFMSS